MEGSAPRVYIAKVTSAITAFDDTTQEIAGVGKAQLKKVAGIAGVDKEITDHAGEIDVNSLERYIHPQDAWIKIVRECASGKWFVVPVQRKPRIRGTISGGNAFTAETANDPHTLTSIEGIDELWSASPTIQIYNPEKIKMWTGATARCEWNATTERYEVYAVTSDKVVHGIQRLAATCEFEKLDGADGWHSWDAGSTYSWVTTVYQSPSGCELLYDTDCSTGVSIIDISNFVTDVIWSDNCLKKFRCGGTYGETIICGEYCTPTTDPCAGEVTAYRAQFVSSTPTWVFYSPDTTCSTCMNGPAPLIPPSAQDAIDGIIVLVPCLP
jgi:hypothetical protein